MKCCELLKDDEQNPTRDTFGGNVSYMYVHCTQYSQSISFLWITNVKDARRGC